MFSFVLSRVCAYISDSIFICVYSNERVSRNTHIHYMYRHYSLQNRVTTVTCVFYMKNKEDPSSNVSNLYSDWKKIYITLSETSFSLTLIFTPLEKYLNELYLYRNVSLDPLKNFLFLSVKWYYTNSLELRCHNLRYLHNMDLYSTRDFACYLYT